MTPTRSVWSVSGFLPTMVAVAAAFGAWSLLLPVIPTAVLDSGGSATLAGASTGIFMAATVLTQLLTPFLLRSVGYRPVMAAAAFLLGVPALGHLLGMEAWIVLLFSALRGVGFGAITVAQSALVAELLPLKLLGKGTGLIGVFVGLSQMVGLPAGMMIAEALGYSAVYLSAAVIALVAAVMCVRIPAIKAHKAEAIPTTNAHRTPMWKLIIVPAMTLSSLSMGYGIVSSFLPAAVRESESAGGTVLGGILLAVVGGASMVSRYMVGVAADRSGIPGRFAIPGQIMGLVGMALMATALFAGWSSAWLMLAAVLFGAAFGIIQNESLLSMFHRLPRSQVSQASAAWSIFYDAGTGIGSVFFGMIVAVAGYAAGFGASALIIALGIVGAVVDHWLGLRRVREHDNPVAR